MMIIKGKSEKHLIQYKTVEFPNKSLLELISRNHKNLRNILLLFFIIMNAMMKNVNLIQFKIVEIPNESLLDRHILKRKANRFATTNSASDSPTYFCRRRLGASSRRVGEEGRGEKVFPVRAFPSNVGLGKSEISGETSRSLRGREISSRILTV